MRILDFVLSVAGAPSYPDPEEDRRMRLLNTMVLGWLASALFAVCMVVLTSQSWTEGIVVTVGLSIVAIGLKLAIHRAWSPRTVTSLFVGTLWVGGVVVVILTGGLRSPLSLLTLPISLGAGLLLGWRSGAILAIMGYAPSILIGLITGKAAPEPIVALGTPLHLQIALTAVTGFTMVLLGAGLRELEEALRAVTSSEHTFRTVTEHTSELVTWIGSSGDLLYISPSCERMTGRTPGEFKENPQLLAEMVHPADRELYDRHVKRELTEQIQLELEYRVLHTDGIIHWISHQCQPVTGDDGPDGRRASNRDVTERKMAELAHIESEERYRRLLESSPVPMLVCVEQEIIMVNPAAATALAVTGHADLIGREFDDLLVDDSSGTAVQELIANGVDESQWTSLRFRTLDGGCIDAEVVGIPIRIDQQDATQIVFLDVTEKLRAAEEIAESQERFRIVTEKSLVGVYILQNGQFRYVNPAFAEMFGYADADELFDRTNPLELVHPEDRERVRAVLEAEPDAEPHSARLTLKGLRVTGELGYFELLWQAAELGGQPAVVGTILDVTNKYLAEQRIQDKLSHLRALRRIDLAITASLNLDYTLEVFLEETRKQLSVHAATVLLVDQATNRLRSAAWDGFHTEALRHTDLGIGEGFAGRAALSRRTIPVLDLNRDPGSFARSPSFMSEGFSSYVAVPLVAKERVLGVLEVLHREPLDPDGEWFEFLEALSGQAAIAIDNANMFDEMSQLNLELVEAYDSTLEGWAKALELRDMETEGHTQRVTNLTVRLARQLGIPEREVDQIRRGALLHDIGKIAIPDEILLKPGPLTDSEWEVMRLHPEYAFQWLSSIEYLQPALEIPYCHHEKWDGSGYPRGLKGREIPLAARIFAVVDVWDALNSDRPYRKAWGVERVVEHIREQSGKHFDPPIVNAFLRLVSRQDANNISARYPARIAG